MAPAQVSTFFSSFLNFRPYAEKAAPFVAAMASPQVFFAAVQQQAQVLFADQPQTTKERVVTNTLVGMDYAALALTAYSITKLLFGSANLFWLLVGAAGCFAHNALTRDLGESHPNVEALKRWVNVPLPLREAGETA